MRVSGSKLVALAILGAIGGWMLTGDLIIGGQPDPSQKTIAEREASLDEKVFRVRTITVQPDMRQSALNVRGRTEVNAKIAIRAETGGTVERRPFDKGDKVNAGDVVCTLDKGIRADTLTQAEAQLAQAEADFKATEQLVKRGYATKSRLRSQRTALDAARAAVSTAKQEMGRTDIIAQASGLVQEPMAEPGDNLSPGGVCVTLVNTDPMKFTGQISERNITDVSLGMEAMVTLVGGKRVPGKLSYISPAADASTRTFEAEISIPNADGSVRDGLTAQAMIPLSPQKAFRVQSNWIVLADDGQVGVRVVDNDKKVAFQPVQIVAQEKDGMWVKGLADGTTVITLGQNYVDEGVTVDPVPQNAARVDDEQSASSTFSGTLDQ